MKRNARAQPLSIGVDIGGTFTDIVTFDSGTGRMSVLKVPTSNDPSAAVVDGLADLGERAGEVSLVSHATTIATNALLTRSGLASTALITNEGFRDILEIGRQRRPELYDLKTRRPPPLVRRRNRFTVACRTTATGSVTQPFDLERATVTAKRIIRGGFESVAVCFLHSHSNPEIELEMRRVMLSQGFRGHISLSSEVDRGYREYERTSTTVVNAALAPLMSSYLSGLKRSLKRMGVSAPLYVMSSDGGMSTLQYAATRPIAAIESGPAAGVLASRELARQLSLDKVLTFDMGGTTAKAGTVIDGEPDVTYEFEAAGRTHSGRSIGGSGYVVRGPFIDIAEVSAGGGTVAWIDDGDALTVGPMSAGSEPGPACYGRGGSDPTVTDANVVLGRINPSYLLGGRMRIFQSMASEAYRRLASNLGMSAEEAAEGVLRLVNSSMAKAISIVSVERGRDPREFAMIAFGGAGPVHCCDMAEELGVREVIVPVHAGLFSAYGLLAGNLARTFTLPVTPGGLSIAGCFNELEEAAANAMKRDGFKRFTSHRYVEARYAGQSHELTLPYTGMERLGTAFGRAHKQLYGYSTSDRVEVVNAKLRGVVERSSRPHLSSSWGDGRRGVKFRRAWFSDGLVRAPVYTREEMRPGDHGVGPCIIEEYDSTLVVNSPWRWRLEEYGTRLTR